MAVAPFCHDKPASPVIGALKNRAKKAPLWRRDLTAALENH
jgi:hypothetical protein